MGNYSENLRLRTLFMFRLKRVRHWKVLDTYLCPWVIDNGLIHRFFFLEAKLGPSIAFSYICIISTQCIYIISQISYLAKIITNTKNNNKLPENKLKTLILKLNLQNCYKNLILYLQSIQLSQYRSLLMCVSEGLSDPFQLYKSRLFMVE